MSPTHLTATRLTWAAACMALAACDPASSPPDTTPDAATADAPPRSEDARALEDASAPADGGSAGCEGALARDLCFLREEEKLARDVYTVLFAETGIAVFDSISRSEQNHTDAVAALLAARSIPDPVTDDSVGVFLDPVIAGLYEALTAEGRMGDVAALRVGATIEDLDLRDIREMSARTTEPAALDLYATLSCGSRNHMRSFASQLEARGESYTAAYISAAELSAILASPREMCGP